MPPPNTGLPRSLERILVDAARDDEFREHLLRDRLEAVRSRGYELTETEEAILQAAPAAQLLLVLDKMPHEPPPPQHVTAVMGIQPGYPMPPIEGIRPGRPKRLVLAAAATAAVAGGAVTLYSYSTRDRPDQADVSQPAGQPDGGTAAEDGGDTPDEPKR